MSYISETNNKTGLNKSIDEIDKDLEKIYEPDLRKLLQRCYQCVRCSGICQLSKVQSFKPSVIIQRILEGGEDKIINSGELWDCLTCNSCLQNCPEDINFADIVRNAKFKMRELYNQTPDDYVAHKGVYITLSEIMSKPYIQPNRDLDWIPKDCEISEKGNTLYFVGCIPFFNFEFDGLDSVPVSTIKMICQMEKEPIVVLKEEACCGHDLYWGQGKFKEFINLAKKNKESFERAGVNTIITACAECYRTLKVEYPKLFDDFEEKFEVKHIIEYIYDNWKNRKIEFINPNKGDKIEFTYHDPCRLSRFLPKGNQIIEQTREIFSNLKELGYIFNEMPHNKENALCCGVSSWMNCNKRSKALRYSRLKEAKSVGSMMITSCPKCKTHLTCLQNDYEEMASIEILDFAEFIINLIKITDTNEGGDK